MDLNARNAKRRISNPNGSIAGDEMKTFNGQWMVAPNSRNRCVGITKYNFGSVIQTS